MNTMLVFSVQKRLQLCGLLAACSLAAAFVGAQSVTPRIKSEIVLSEVSPLKGSVHPLAQAQFDAGRVPADTKLSGISIVFNRTAAQDADLQTLIAAQQNPASPLYHQWLNPDQFAKRFGMAQADLDKVQTWLQQQGFAIDSVARSRNMIRFSGSVRQVENAFSTQMHYYKINGEQHFAPSAALSLPAAVTPIVEAVRNLDDFRPRPMHVTGKSARVRPGFTSSQSTSVFFAPGDIKTVYDFAPLTGGNFTGTGQSIAVVGQSAVLASDIEAFQSAAGLTVKDPTMVLVPGTGGSTIFSGDETESDLDLEWSGAMAPGADIFFVYVGSGTTLGAFDAIQYAVDQKIAQIISVSYGLCEPLLGSQAIDSSLQQAAAQGQTIISASGDAGATACFFTSAPSSTDPTVAQQEVLAVNYPASSPYVTGMGGTEIDPANAAYMTQGSAYWAAPGSSDVISSALQYIPEVAWNDDKDPNCSSSSNSTDCISASGGGASALFTTKPTWQTGVAGIPNDGKRDVPDIALYSSAISPGYLLCTSDISTGQQVSCTSGFRSANGGLTVIGGTSVAAPIFAGMLAILNQKAGYTGGQGLINPTLYSLASASTTYASAFHDITSGNNFCTAGSTFCSSSTAGFSAGIGYDQVTGLGSVDLGNLANAWPANGSPLPGTITSINALSLTPLVSVADNFTITVTTDSGSPVTSGTLTLVIDGGPKAGGPAEVTTNLTSNGTATYSTSFSTTGTHQIIANYPGDATHAASTGVVQLTVGTPSSGKGTIALVATPASLSVTQGTSGNETITVTPAGGYTGTVLLTLSATDTNLTNLCYNFPNINSSGQGPVTVSGTAPASTQLNLDTLPADCGAVSRRIGGSPLHRLGGVKSAAKNETNPAPLAVAFGGMLLVGFLGRYSRKLSALAGMAVLVVMSLTVTACGGGNGGNSTSVTPDPPKGTYTVTVTGQDSVTAAITGTTKFTFLIQ